MLGAFDHTAFDAARPTAFYLEDEGMLEAADSTWLCTGGEELPVHSQLVSLRSPVLRDAYRALRESAQVEAPGPATRKRARQEPLGRPPLRLPIGDCPLKAVVVFLRFLYQPEAVTAANLGSLGDLLPAVARLAHMFSVARVVACVEEWLMQPDQAKTTAKLAVSLDLAETLHLDDLRANTLMNIAKQLVKLDTPLSRFNSCPTMAPLIDVAQLGLGEGDRLRLLAVLTAALRNVPVDVGQQIFSQLPAQDVIMELGQLQGITGEFIWDVPGFSVEKRHAVLSPVFSVGGHSWHLQLHPYGRPGSEDSVSAYLFLSGFQEGERGVHAAVRLMVGGTAGNSICRTTSARLFKGRGWGAEFGQRRLITHPAGGFLANDTLRITAEVVC